ncbi:hypothetical protein J53TS2_32510 [Paenibacillus sp. J53TS2]|nr:hypothetical protein J53TS2_32510 [Paenibacillus sp. J53TS2]
MMLMAQFSLQALELYDSYLTMSDPLSGRSAAADKSSVETYSPYRSISII